MPIVVQHTRYSCPTDDSTEDPKFRAAWPLACQAQKYKLRCCPTRPSSHLYDRPGIPDSVSRWPCIHRMAIDYLHPTARTSIGDQHEPSEPPPFQTVFIQSGYLPLVTGLLALCNHDLLPVRQSFLDL